MGLDMNLFKKTYVTNWSKKPEEQLSVDVKLCGEHHPSIKPERISWITEDIMYWRKANQIHGWFCNNTREIVDNVHYEMERKDLEKLLSVCKQVLQILNNAPKKTTKVVGGWKNGEEFLVDVEVYDNIDEVMEILPPTEGFFFGTYEVDEYYKKTLEGTVEFLEEELSSPEIGWCVYEYNASW